MTDALPRPIAFTMLGGPSVLIEYAGARFLIDPTFDAPGEYPIGTRALTKLVGPALGPDEVGPVDAVLLSHDQHPDNLDRAGRQFLTGVPLVFTTTLAATRLEGPARGLTPWESTTVGDVTVTAVPAQHGPDGCEELTGPVIGFVLSAGGASTIYVSGDNASLAVVREVATRFPDIGIAVLFAGAARTALIDGFLTLQSQEAVEAARLLGNPRVIPVHTDGWGHFTEDGSVLRAEFARAGTAALLVDTTPGVRIVL